MFAVTGNPLVKGVKLDNPSLHSFPFSSASACSGLFKHFVGDGKDCAQPNSAPPPASQGYSGAAIYAHFFATAADSVNDPGSCSDHRASPGVAGCGKVGMHPWKISSNPWRCYNKSKQKGRKKVTKDPAGTKRARHEVGNITKRRKAAIFEDVVTDEGKEKMMTELLNLTFTPGTLIQRRACWNSWSRFHKSWFGDVVPVLPLTTHKIMAVASMFRAGGYRSFDNYLSAARQAHIEDGGEFNDMLKLSAKRASRAVNRGIGPPKQSDTFDFESFAKYYHNQHSREPCLLSGPIWPSALIIFGVMFLMREVELAFTKIEDIALDVKRIILTWRLPTSKTDPRGRGCSRQWGCLCSSPGSFSCSFCPFCIMAMVMNVERHRPGHEYLFCDGTCEQVTKRTMVKSMVITVKLAINIDDLAITGHFMRILGSRFLAKLGIELALIQILGRWDSKVILHYVADAPASTITMHVKSKLSTTPIESLRLQAHGQEVLPPTIMDETIEKIAAARAIQDKQSIDSKIDILESKLDEEITEVDSKMRNLSFEIGLLRELVDDDIQAIRARITKIEVARNTFIKLATGAKLHVVSIGVPAAPIKWRTRCGERFAHASFEVFGKSEGHDLCTRCFRL